VTDHREERLAHAGRGRANALRRDPGQRAAPSDPSGQARRLQGVGLAGSPTVQVHWPSWQPQASSTAKHGRISQVVDISPTEVATQSSLLQPARVQSASVVHSPASWGCSTRASQLAYSASGLCSGPGAGAAGTGSGAGSGAVGGSGSGASGAAGFDEQATSHSIVTFMRYPPGSRGAGHRYGKTPAARGLRMSAKLKWSVVGVGTAGRARAKAIVADPRARLVAVHRGRFASEVEAPAVAAFDDAVSLADAVAIASPTALHAGQVEAALRAGRHVLVEFPLAATAAAAERLFALADEVGKVLHVEHIELLDPPSVTLRAHVRREVVRHVEVYFERGAPAGASPEELALGNVARLHRVTALTGPLRSIDAVEHDGRALTARFTLASGGTVHASFDQAPELKRRTVLRVESAGGTTWEQVNGTLTRNGAPQTLLGVGSLFRRDQVEATAMILDGRSDYVTRSRILHVLDVVERLGRREIGGLPHRLAA